jgi:hypothetical protein
VIDFSKDDPEDDFSKVLNNKNSMYLDVKRLKSAKDLNRAKKPEKREKKLESIYDKIKRCGAERFGAKSIKFVKYLELANKFISDKPELKMSFDLLMKSDAKLYG